MALSLLRHSKRRASLSTSLGGAVNAQDHSFTQDDILSSKCSPIRNPWRHERLESPFYGVGVHKHPSGIDDIVGTTKPDKATTWKFFQCSPSSPMRALLLMEHR